MSEPRDPASYVLKIREETSSYIREILAENERLRALVASLEESQLRSREETNQLQEQMIDLGMRLEKFEVEKRRLSRRLSEVEEENREYSTRYVDVEERNDDLMKLYVASYRLHSTLKRTQVLDTLHEIIINLVGSEDFAIFEHSEELGGLHLTSAFGLTAEQAAAIDARSGLMADVVAAGEVRLTSNDAGSSLDLDRPLACIPLHLDDELVGLISIFRLVDHKPALDDLDRELLELLASQAGATLVASRLYESSLLEV